MTDSLLHYWQALGWPLCRLLLGMAFGLLVANILEALRWTRHLARLSAPLARAAHLREVAGAAFALAFVSPAGANGLRLDNRDVGSLDHQVRRLYTGRYRFVFYHSNRFTH